MYCENMFFESHAHYDDERFDDDRKELLSSLPAFSVGVVINSGASISSSRKGIELSEEYPYIYAAVGVHPHEVKNMTDADLAVLGDMCGYEKVVAIGEIGLDYYYDLSPRDLQSFWFKEQMKLAAEKRKPVIIHSRDAAEETFEIVKGFSDKALKGVIHCYSGSYEMAADYVKLGYYIGIGGVVTYKNARKLIEVVEKIPLDMLLVETDCPYLSPEPLRGKRNDSKNLKYIADKIAEIKGVSANEVINATFENGKALFGLESVLGRGKYAE